MALRVRRSESPCTLAMRLPAILVLGASLVACGGLAQEGGPGRDGAADTSALPSEASSDTDGSTTSDSGGPRDGGIEHDTSAPVDAGPPFVDARYFPSCNADPCGYEQLCVNNVPGPGDSEEVPWSSCGSIPTACEPSPTCACVQMVGSSCPCEVQGVQTPFGLPASFITHAHTPARPPAPALALAPASAPASASASEPGSASAFPLRMRLRLLTPPRARVDTLHPAWFNARPRSQRRPFRLNSPQLARRGFPWRPR
jgi:hypothetical protein